jgi:hypothetical protein
MASRKDAPTVLSGETAQRPGAVDRCLPNFAKPTTIAA